VGQAVRLLTPTNTNAPTTRSHRALVNNVQIYFVLAVAFSKAIIAHSETNTRTYGISPALDGSRHSQNRGCGSYAVQYHLTSFQRISA